MSLLYRAELIDQQKTLSAQLKNAQDKAKMTGDTVWADEAATLQLSLDSLAVDTCRKELEVLEEEWSVTKGEQVDTLKDMLNKYSKV